MAKKSMIERDLKRARMIKKYAPERARLKAILSDPKASEEAFYQAQRDLAQLPRNSSAVRHRNRCIITGRPRAYMRKFHLSRIAFRELALAGQIPGVTKSSW
jgi:small subunit ribosomal protein S14